MSTSCTIPFAVSGTMEARSYRGKSKLVGSCTTLKVLSDWFILLYVGCVCWTIYTHYILIHVFEPFW